MFCNPYPLILYQILQKQVHSVTQPRLSNCHLACAAAQVTSCIHVGGDHLVVNLQAHCLEESVRDGIRIGEGELNTVTLLAEGPVVAAYSSPPSFGVDG